MRNKDIYIRYKQLIEYLNNEICFEAEKNIEEIDTVYIEECKDLILDITENCNLCKEE